MLEQNEEAVDQAIKEKIEELVFARNAWKNKDLDAKAREVKVLVANKGMNRSQRRKALK